MITNAGLIRELRQPGKVTVPVMTATDVIRIVAEKSDLIAELESYEGSAPAPWRIVSASASGTRNLDYY